MDDGITRRLAFAWQAEPDLATVRVVHALLGRPQRKSAIQGLANRPMDQVVVILQCLAQDVVITQRPLEAGLDGIEYELTALGIAAWNEWLVLEALHRLASATVKRNLMQDKRLREILRVISEGRTTREALASRFGKEIGALLHDLAELGAIQEGIDDEGSFVAATEIGKAAASHRELPDSAEDIYDLYQQVSGARPNDNLGEDT